MIAYPSDHTRFEAPPLASGARLRGADAAEVGVGLAQVLGLSPGSTLALALPSGVEARFRVSGTVDSLDHDGRVAYVAGGRAARRRPGGARADRGARCAPAPSRPAPSSASSSARRAPSHDADGDRARADADRALTRDPARRRRRRRLRLPLHARAGARARRRRATRDDRGAARLRRRRAARHAAARRRRRRRRRARRGDRASRSSGSCWGRRWLGSPPATRRWRSARRRAESPPSWRARWRCSCRRAAGSRRQAAREPIVAGLPA